MDICRGRGRRQPPPLNVNDGETLEAQVFDCTVSVTRAIIVHVRGGDILRLAVAPGVGISFS